MLGVRGVCEQMEKTANAGSKVMITVVCEFANYLTVGDLKQLLDLHAHLRSQTVGVMPILVLTVTVGPEYHTHMKAVIAKLFEVPNLGNNARSAYTVTPRAFGQYWHQRALVALLKAAWQPDRFGLM